METLLNLCWAIIAVTTLSVWVLRRRSAPVSRFTDGEQLVALGCALVLLFFPISLTDDLHPEIFLVMDSSSARRSLPALIAAKSHDASTGTWSAVPFAAFLLARTQIFNLVMHGLVNAEVRCSEQSSGYGFTLARSPPLSLA